MRKMGKKLVIMVCIAAMIMTNLPNWDAGADVSGTAWSETGDTLIGNATVWKNEIITLNGNLTVNETGNLTISNVLLTLNGNLTVNETGKLTLDNVTLLMNCSENGSYHIEVKAGGEMYILNNSNITSTDPNAHYLFWVRNDSKFEMRDSELSECGYEWGGTMELAGLWINTNNTVFENNNISNNGGGIIFYNSHNNIIKNTNITDNDIGVFLDASSDNTISNSNISSNNWRGIFFTFSDCNTITNCDISSNLDGIVLEYSSNNTVTNCRIYLNDNYGIGIENSLDNIISNCTIFSNSDKGIFIFSSDDITISDCNMSSNMLGGVEISKSSMVIAGTTISSNGVGSYSDKGGIWCEDSSLTVINTKILSNHPSGIFCLNSSTAIMDSILDSRNALSSAIYTVGYSDSSGSIVNSTISGNYSNPDYHDIYLSSDSCLYLLNTTFTNVSFADNASVLNVSWYLNVNVTWKNNINAEYANVTITDNLTNEVFNGSTDRDGWIKDIVIQEYTQNQTNTTSFTPHNVTASQGNISVWKNITVNETKTIELVLDYNAPVISNISTVSPEYDENTTVEFSFNVSHPDNLNLTYYWYLYLNETEVENATGALENTNITQEINWTYYFNFTSHGNYTVKVTVSDENATVSCTWVLTVNDVNGRPWITCFYPPKGIVLGNLSCVIFNVTASDPDNDEINYQWRQNGVEVSNENKYIFSAEYNASGNNTYIIEIKITDGKLSDNRTWAVTVVDWNASYDKLLLQIELLKNAIENITKLIGNVTETLLNQTELLENITWLVENITALNMTVLKDKLNQLFIELENMNITLVQMNENLTRIQEELNISKGDIENLTKMLEEANASRDQAVDNETMALNAKENAENAAAVALKEKDEAIKAKNKAEYKLAASVVFAVIGGVIAGFLVSFLLRRKLPKKG